VSAASAAIGDAGSGYRAGMVSVVNDAARAHGARPGARACEMIDQWATAML
jgi:hypothetical protein